MGFSWGNIVNDVGGLLSQAPTIAIDALTQGGYSNAKAASDTNQKSMDFNERMSNTAYQRATADMRAAGLNPMLAYQQGGASTPGANLTPPEPGKIGAGLANSAKDALNLDTNLKNTKSDTELKKASKTEAENRATKTEIEATNALTEREILKHQVTAEKATAQKKKMETELLKERFPWDKNMQKYDSAGERIGPLVEGASKLLIGKKVLEKVLTGGSSSAKSVDQLSPIQKMHLKQNTSPNNPFRK